MSTTAYRMVKATLKARGHAVAEAIEEQNAQPIETEHGNVYALNQGADANPNAPAKGKIVITGGAPHYQYYGEIRVATLMAPFEISGMIGEQYHDTFESALAEIVKTIPHVDAHNEAYRQKNQ